MKRFLVPISLALTLLPLSALANTLECGYYTPGYYDLIGASANVDASQNPANIGSSPSWLFTGPYIYTNGYSNFVGVGVIENHSGMFGSYWRRVGFMNQYNNSITFNYPPYNPDSSGYNYHVYYDQAANRYRYLVGGNTDGYSFENANISSSGAFEIDGGCLGTWSDVMYSLSKRLWNYRAYHRSNGTQWPASANEYTFDYSRARLMPSNGFHDYSVIIDTRGL